MAKMSTTPRTQYQKRTICLKFDQDQYLNIVADPKCFRRHLDRLFRTDPENFPPDFQNGYRMKDIRTSRKLKLPIRRITLNTGKIDYSIRPSFVLSSLTAKVDEVDGIIFGKFVKFLSPIAGFHRSLRKFSYITK